MFCKKCGARIPDEHTRFCPSCGEPIEQEKLGPSQVEKGLWIVIGVVILLAAFFFLQPQPHTRSVQTISSPQLNANAVSPGEPGQSHSPLGLDVSPPPPPPAASVTPSQTPSSALYASLVKALKGTRYSIELKHSHQKKAFRVTASLLYDNQSRETYLNIFSRFFSICYSERRSPLIVADISLKQADGTVLMRMGIGRKVADSVPAGTWRQFSDMGPSLLNWVQNHEVTNPPSPEMACFFEQNKKF